jgi:AcrR family transcriptional regulator
MLPKEDLRVRRTRKLLRDALVRLIETHGFEHLTVNAIADAAMINRVTFYRHFRDKNDLLERCMDDVFEELIGSRKPPVLEHHLDPMQAPLQNLVMVFEHVAYNADFYRVMLGQAGAGAFTARLRRYLEQEIETRLRFLRQNAAPPAVPVGLDICFIASAYLGAIVWWLEHGSVYTPEQMAAYLLTLTVKGPYAVLGLPYEV